MPNVIRVGDPTSHGGNVLSSSVGHFTVGGKAVVVVGDKCSCPVNGHQNCTVATGSSTHMVNGKAVAYNGDTTSCGATLIATVDNFASA
ncbi:PAAR domain-containing protein [Rugamonas sp. FT82W]|uniref:PAAR domain-containing protein n=1 Tax=Duganella vulcania TaxID=2692166 RepID=A0A845GD94_9BURK|nr:PAAR domain-containing protein [Duganella vulcania]MYM90769.1 PAAR domain-containing protein [Duganella vulcania]